MLAIKTHLKKYGESTSVKGVSKVIKSKYLGLRGIWLFASITGASVAIYQLVILFSSYLKYETTTQISQCSGCRPEFPDVTICNLNPLSMVSSFDDLLEFEHYLEIINSFEEMDDDNLEHILNNLHDGREGFDEILFGAFYSLAGYLQNLNATSLLEQAAKRSSSSALVSYCEWFDWDAKSYLKEKCTNQSQYFFVTPDYSVCTTIHMNESNTNSNSTEVKGFEALLFINDFANNFMVGYEHNILKSQARGARVLIHPPNSLPDMRKGFNVPAGNEVSIHLDAIEVTRLPEPYSDCTNQEHLEDAEIEFEETLLQNFIYNAQSAISLCQQENVVKECRCFHPSLPVTVALKDEHHVPGCIQLIMKNASMAPANGTLASDINLNTSAEHANCYYRMEDESKKGGAEKCKFRQSCNEKKYQYKTHSSQWPHESYQLAFYCKHIDNRAPHCEDFGEYKSSPGLADIFAGRFDGSHMDGNDDTFTYLKEQDTIERNFIQLKVYFLEPDKIIYKDVPTVTPVYIFGSVGGILNLWIGVTVFTMIELVDFIYTVIVDYWERRKEQKKEKIDKDKVYPLDSSFNTE